MKPRIVYCHCTYAQVVPPEVKEAVLRRLSEAGVEFEAVADMCEMSARQSASLRALANGGEVKIAACFPRAIKWLFASAKAPLEPGSTEVLNMRTLSADEIVEGLFREGLQPNLPTGKVTASDAPPSTEDLATAQP
jgi:hypothetical protein